MGTSAQAHLMVAQHGTLNFLDDNVYLVLSLPASAFTDADEDNDEHLSLTEFSQHRTNIIELVNANVTLSSGDNNLPLTEILVSPVTPHDAPKEPANQIIVMGRFSLKDDDEKLKFHVGLFGTKLEAQSLEITANRKSADQKQVFVLSPNKSVATLTFN